jgi:hypothetical protein
VNYSSGMPQNGGVIALAVTSGPVNAVSSDACDAMASDTTNGESAEDLPTRPIPERQLMRKIRHLDDPEILQRVLAGLLNLP